MIAAVLVTHNSAVFLPELLASIDRQTLLPDIRLAVDDNSTDTTRDLLERAGFTVLTTDSVSSKITTRIAQNFVHAVTAATERGARIVVFGDHDDLWHPHRIAHQVQLMEAHPTVSMVASNGRTPEGSLRTTFPVPADFNDLDSAAQWKYVAKHSVATGGASAISPHRLSTIAVPNGWLHDRWWSLRAVRENSLWIDPELVIDYRVSPDQQVGLDTAGQHNPVAWVWHKVRSLPTTIRKMKDIAGLLSETTPSKRFTEN